MGQLVDHADEPDDRRRVDVHAAALVVQGHVPADDRHPEGQACRRSEPGVGPLSSR